VNQEELGPGEALDLFQDRRRERVGRALKGLGDVADLGGDPLLGPPGGDAGEVSPRDPQAGWTKKNGRSRFGYKAHAAVDEGSGLVREAVMTLADVHDSVPADGLVQGDEQAVYADKAYDDTARRKRLKAQGIEPRIMYQARRNRPLKPWQTAFNKAVAPIRAGVERLFATMKRAYGYRRVRYLGLARNDVQLQTMCAAINMRRALALGLA